MLPQTAKQAVQDAIPYAVKAKEPNGYIIDGWLTGRKCDFPQVHFSGNRHVEVSWELANNLLLGLLPYITL